MFENRFYKVSHTGGTYVTGMFFNPVTGEEKSELLRDYDYSDCSRDNDELYYMPIDEEVRTAWLHTRGVILVRDQAKVVKSRTIEHGFVGTIRAIHDFTDRYGRTQATYLYFTDGRKINKNNCELVMD